MKKTRIGKIEQALDKMKADLPDRQVATDHILHDLHRAYGDRNTPTLRMHWKDFDEMVERVINRVKS